MTEAEVLDFAAITAAGIPGALTALQADGTWITYKDGDWNVAVAYGWDGEDEQGQTWWTGTRYVNGEPADTFSYSALAQLLDHVAKALR